MNRPLVSIIVPIYNVAPYLKKCLDSIAAQTYSNIEILLIDDGSPDQCGAICDIYAARDSRFVVIHQNNNGVSSARNIGIDHAKGEYIMFVDGDDYISPHMCEILLQSVLKQNADLAICGLYRINSRGEKNEDVPYPQELTGKELVMQYFLKGRTIHLSVVWNKLYKASLFNCPFKIRFPLHMIEEDEYVSYKILYRANKVIILNKPLYFYIYRENSIMHNTAIDHRECLYQYALDYYQWAHNDAPDMIPVVECSNIHLFNFFVWQCLCGAHFAQMQPVIKKLEQEILHHTRNLSRNPYATLRTKKIYQLMKWHLLIPTKRLELILGKRKITNTSS